MNVVGSQDKLLFGFSVSFPRIDSFMCRKQMALGEVSGSTSKQTIGVTD